MILKFGRPLFVLFFVFFSFISNGQDLERDYGKNEIGLDAYGLLSNTQLGTMYRRHFEKGAIRSWVRAGKYSSSQRGDWHEKQMSNLYGAGIGYQFNKDWNHWRIYYGADLNFNHKEEFRRLNYEHLEHHTEKTVKSASFGISPILGVTYFFSKRFSFSIETALNLSLANEQYKDVRIPYSGTPEEFNSSGNRERVSFRPINNFLLSFHF